MKKSLGVPAIILSMFVAAFSFAGCSGTGTSPSPSPQSTSGAAQTPAPVQPSEKTDVKIAALKGPTGMGMAKLMEDSKENKTANNYIFELSGAPDDIVGKLTSGSIDIAAIPTNLASVLYNKTGGNIRLAAINTLGVLHVLENGDSIKSIEDLKGKTIAATGQGSTPEFALNYILEQNGLEPGKDITVKFLSEHSELAALVAAGKENLAMLPEPFVTTVLSKNTGARAALDITKEWALANEKAGNKDSELVMGCLVVRKDFAEKSKAALDAFLTEYKASADFVNASPAEASKFIASHGIIADAALAEKAIPNCNIVYIDGSKMKKSAESYFDILMKADPKSIGGKIPNEDFYYSR